MNHAGAGKRGWKALTRANPNTRRKRGGLSIGFSGYLIGTALWMKVHFGCPEIAKIQAAGREDCRQKYFIIRQSVEQWMKMV